MPKSVEKEIKDRGGAVKWRTITLPKSGRKLKVAIVKEPGPKGGKTVASEGKE